MANWQHRLDLMDLWKKYDNNEMNVSQVGVQIAERLSSLDLHGNLEGQRDDLVECFQGVGDIGDFDNTMELLYDLADTPLRTLPGQMQRKLMWVATRF